MVNSVAAYLKQTVKMYPDKVAFRDAEKSVTFYELDRYAMAVAKRIHSSLKGY